MRISIPDYEKHRDYLLKWDWLTESFDSNINASVYKLTKRGLWVYTTILRAVGVDSLVNGHKIKLKELHTDKVVLNGYDPDERVLQALIKSKIMTYTINPETEEQRYQLTPYGAKLFIAFFVSLDRQVGTLPGDKLAKFMKIMANMPKYSMKFSEIMGNIADGFAKFDKKQGNQFRSKMNFSDNTDYSKVGERMMNFNTSKPNWRSDKKQNNNWKPKKKKYKPKYQKYQKSKPDQVGDHYSKVGRDMMKDFW